MTAPTVVGMGASRWSYFVAYQPDPRAAFDALRARVFAEGDYWWAVAGEWQKSARDYPDRPRTIEDLFAQEAVQEAGTHSILDMERMLPAGETPNYGWLTAMATVTSPYDLGRLFAEHNMPEYGTVALVTAAETLEYAGVEKLTREHLDDIDLLVKYRGFGRCVVLHDATGTPTEFYFWGFSGD